VKAKSVFRRITTVAFSPGAAYTYDSGTATYTRGAITAHDQFAPKREPAWKRHGDHFD
jgi:hypothetical protein